jgi:BMFP domain-containing protein YqiC
MPDFRTIANFRKDNGRAIRKVCRQFIVLCRQLDLFTQAIIAIDGSKFKAVNNRDKNFTPAKMQRRMAQIEESIARYLADMDTADRAEPEVAELKKGRLRDKIAALKERMQQLKIYEAQMLASPDQQLSLTDPDARWTVCSLSTIRQRKRKWCGTGAASSKRPAMEYLQPSMGRRGRCAAPKPLQMRCARWASKYEPDVTREKSSSPAMTFSGSRCTLALEFRHSRKPRKYLFRQRSRIW